MYKKLGLSNISWTHLRCFSTLLLSVTIQPDLLGGVLYPNSALVWGIDTQTLSIQGGHVITEAVLTFHKFRVENNSLSADWNAPGRVDMGGYALMAHCWRMDDHDRLMDMTDVFRLSKNWLTTDCSDCGGADITGDGAVGLDDLMVVADRWLSPAGRTECRDADWTGDGWINTKDLMEFAELWLQDAPVRASADPITDHIMKVYLLKNPRLGLVAASSTTGQDPFATYGTIIRSVHQDGSLVYRFSLNHNPDSFYSQTFGGRFYLPLADGTTAVLTSTLLELIDYAGSGYSFGFGMAMSNGRCFYEKITLDLTIQSYAAAPYKTTLHFAAP